MNARYRSCLGFLRLLASAMLVMLATPTFGQDDVSDEGNDQPLTLAAAVDLTASGTISDSEVIQLAQRLATARGVLTVTERPGHVSADFALDDISALVTGETQADGRVEVFARVGGMSFDLTHDPVRSTNHFDGYGSSKGVEESLVLLALVYVLERENWDGIQKQSTPEKTLAYTLINMLSYAPLDHRFDASTIKVEPGGLNGESAPSDLNLAFTMLGADQVHRAAYGRMSEVA